MSHDASHRGVVPSRREGCAQAGRASDSTRMCTGCQRGGRRTIQAQRRLHEGARQLPVVAGQCAVEQGRHQRSCRGGASTATCCVAGEPGRRPCRAPLSPHTSNERRVDGGCLPSVHFCEIQMWNRTTGERENETREVLEGRLVGVTNEPTNRHENYFD